MPERVTIIETVGVFRRSVKNVFGGAVLFTLAFPMMFWNECSSVRTAKSLDEGLGVVVRASADRLDAANEGALVHVSGPAQTTETLSDAAFGVSVQALRLERSVEMYQWRERSTTRADNTRQSSHQYQEVWADELIDSSRFDEHQTHTNPTSMPYASQSYAAQLVTLGVFTLSADQLSQLSASEVFVPEGTRYPVHDGYLYLGEDPAAPAIGDVRVQLRVLRPGPLSVVARQSGQTFSSYPTSTGRSVSLIQTGVHSAEDMFADAQAANTALTWGFRALAFFMVFFGMRLIIAPLKVLADRVPLLGSIFRAGISVVTFFLASALTLLTISVAWLVARPLLGIALLMLGGGALMGAVILVVRVSRTTRTADGLHPDG